nr:exonuclease SbcC [Escherichia coli]
MKSYLNINSLILVGVRKNYVTTFYKGLNVIYGDSDTGKSSILEFINYLLGASSIDLADEIKTSVNYAALEVVINDTVFTIVRDIYDHKKAIEVYRCKFDDLHKHFPKKYAPNYSPLSNVDGVFSEFLLDSLNFPKIEIKVSPSKAHSQMRRLSFRNIYKFVYVSQDDIGSKSFLRLGDWSRYAFTKEVFKYMFNVLDESIARLQGEISAKSSLVTELNRKYQIISEFLRDTDYETIESIDDEINRIDLVLEELVAGLSALDKNMKADSIQYTELKDAHNFISLKYKECILNITALEDKIDKYSRLKNDYDNDIEKLKAIKTANSRIGVLDKEVFSCPVCDSHIKIDDSDFPFEISSEKDLNEELNSLSRRRRNINDMISEMSFKLKKESGYKKELDERLDELRELIDEESQSMITPFLTQRDFYIKEISKNEKVREQLVKDLKVRNQQEELLEKYQVLRKDIEALTERLEALKKNAPSMEGILQGLGDRFSQYLKGINIKNRTGIKISESYYIPVIREKEYF